MTDICKNPPRVNGHCVTSIGCILFELKQSIFSRMDKLTDIYILRKYHMVNNVKNRKLTGFLRGFHCY